jgi:hypothetical protein
MHSRLALVTFVDGHGGDKPDNSLPGQGGRPDNSLPGGERPVDPGYGVPAPGTPVQLPVYPFDPTIDNSLPGGRPPHASQMPIYPGAKFVVKWLTCKGLVLVPDNSLPGQGSGAHPDQGLPGGPPPRPDQGLPGSQPKPDQGLPGQPGRPDQGLPPTAQPKK